MSLEYPNVLSIKLLQFVTLSFVVNLSLVISNLSYYYMFNCFLTNLVTSNTGSVSIALLSIAGLLTVFTQIEEINIGSFHIKLLPVPLDKNTRKIFLLGILVMLSIFIILVFPLLSMCKPLTCAKSIVVNGSISMAGIIPNDLNYFKNNCSLCDEGRIEYLPTGSEKGILALTYKKDGTNIAASSRPLTLEEKKQLSPFKVSTDQIAIVVRDDNPFIDFLTNPEKGLSKEQIKKIYQGDITKWSQIDELYVWLFSQNKINSIEDIDQEIQVINLPEASGTYTVFKKLVLDEENIGDTDNIITVPSEAPSQWLYSILNKYGIGYSSSSLVSAMREIELISIDKSKPGDGGYPLKRDFWYVYKKPLSGDAQLFIKCIENRK